MSDIPALPRRRIGDREVSCVGLGCMPLSDERMLEQRDRALATVHAALDAGVTLLDTANIYAPSWDTVGHNESVVAEAVRTWTAPVGAREGVLVATKGGIVRGPGETWGRDAAPEALLRAAEASAERLGVASIDLYQLHRLDPDRTVRDQIRALAAVRDAGLARMIGLSNVTRAELEVAIEEVGGPADGGIVSVQNEFSPRYRADADVIPRCEELGIAFLPWSPLGGADRASDSTSDLAAFGEVAAAHGVSPQRAVLAWLLSRSPVTVAIPGSTRPETILDSVAAAGLTLSAEEVARLDATGGHLVDSTFPDHVPRAPLG